MSAPSPRKAAPILGVVTLSRSQVVTILVHNMGWEYIDVTSFWRLARKLQPKHDN
jgi:hypothetical protein